MSRLTLTLVLASIVACAEAPPDSPDGLEARVIQVIQTDTLNVDVLPGFPTIDIGMYLLATERARYNARMPQDEIVRRYRLAKDVFSEVGVQLNLLWIKTVALEPERVAIRSNVMAGTVAGEIDNLYKKIRVQQSTLSPEAEEVFEAIIEPAPQNDRTIYLVGMEDVLMGWYEEQEGGEWQLRYDTTNALSFPGYSLEDRIPRRLRGVITVQNIFKSEKIIAHELGHKLLNVSHEYRDISPAHEVNAEGGLMVYGEGTEIASGFEGRWHLERLMLSPFLYRVSADGSRQYNPDYAETGHYADPIYEGLVRYE